LSSSICCLKEFKDYVVSGRAFLPGILDPERNCVLYGVYTFTLYAYVDGLVCMLDIIDVGIPYGCSLVTMGIEKFCIERNLLSNEVLT